MSEREAPCVYCVDVLTSAFPSLLDSAMRFRCVDCEFQTVRIVELNEHLPTHGFVCTNNIFTLNIDQFMLLKEGFHQTKGSKPVNGNSFFRMICSSNPSAKIAKGSSSNRKNTPIRYLHERLCPAYLDVYVCFHNFVIKNAYR